MHYLFGILTIAIAVVAGGWLGRFVDVRRWSFWAPIYPAVAVTAVLVIAGGWLAILGLGLVGLVLGALARNARSPIA